MDELQNRLWAAEQEILDVIHEVCVQNHLRYSLAYGTLLGAVRHQGFIPWDDDIDVMMPREDYDRLISVWDTAAPQGYLLETERSSSDYVNIFAKVRKDHTTFLQDESDGGKKHHKGIFVDIFPLDRRAGSLPGRYVQYALFAFYLLYNRGFRSGSGGLTGVAERVLLKAVPKSAYRRLSIRAGERSRAWNGNPTAEWISPCTIRDCRRYYPADLFDEFVPMDFNGKRYCATKRYDQFLTIRYGDYMQLPPEEERVWKHHPILIDFDHNYEELV